MSCIVSERGTPLSTPNSLVFGTREIFSFPGINCISGLREIARNSQKSIGGKSDFFVFPTSTKYHVEVPKSPRITQI